jgi:hypothetical protein
MTVAENLAILKTHLLSLEGELADLQRGKKASGARSRKLLQMVKVTAHEMRKQVVEHVKSLPIKKKKAKVVPVDPVPIAEVPVEVKVAKKKK